VADVRDDGALHPCALAVGKLFADGLHDPRMTLDCGFARKSPVAFGWLTPRRSTRWLAVRTSFGDEIYEVKAALPVRIAVDEGVSTDDASATVEIRELSASGQVISEGATTMRVAG
jgi:hypothetical protein